MSKVTVRDVAKAAGVSVATVSRVMNGATGVSPDLRERVLKAIKETHYVPNVAGRVLRQQRSSLIAVVTPEPENPYFMRLTAEVEWHDAMAMEFSLHIPIIRFPAKSTP